MAIQDFDTTGYRGTILPDDADLAALAAAANDYRIMLGAVMEAIADRYDRRPDYRFIDTKLNLITGRDFPDDDPLRGPGTIYGWIQGRGLEALAGHEAWLRRSPHVAGEAKQRLGGRLRRMMAEVLEQMESIRQANRGRLFFTMTVEGQPLRMAEDGKMVPHEVPPDGPANTTELFYVKGMAAAAHALGDETTFAAARKWYEKIHRDIQEGTFARDQQPLDPTNVAVRDVPGRRSHGARMLAMGAAALLLERTGEPKYQDMGLGYLDHILQYHVNLAGEGDLSQRYDMWEFVDEAGRPFLQEGGALLSDPGHACECVGLALKLLGACERAGSLESIDPQRLGDYYRILPGMLKRNFANGFSPRGFGIVKAFDLVARRPLRTDMPWWNLPETMRAALAAARVVPAGQRPEFVRIAARCSNAFLGRFVRPDLHLMAYQTIDETGRVIETIPATPDADPGYHTGLSIIDYLDLLEALSGGG